MRKRKSFNSKMAAGGWGDQINYSTEGTGEQSIPGFTTDEKVPGNEGAGTTGIGRTNVKELVDLFPEKWEPLKGDIDQTLSGDALTRHVLHADLVEQMRRMSAAAQVMDKQARASDATSCPSCNGLASKNGKVCIDCSGTGLKDHRTIHTNGNIFDPMLSDDQINRGIQRHNDFCTASECLNDCIVKPALDREVREPNRRARIPTKMNEVKVKSGSGYAIRDLLKLRKHKDAMGPVAEGLLAFQRNPMDTFAEGNLVLITNHNAAAPWYSPRTVTVNTPGYNMDGGDVIRQVPISTERGPLLDPRAENLASADQQSIGIVGRTLAGGNKLEVVQFVRPGQRINDVAREHYERARGEYDGSLEFGSDSWLNRSGSSLPLDTVRAVMTSMGQHFGRGLSRRSTAPLTPRDATVKIIGPGQATRLTIPSLASVCHVGSIDSRLSNGESVTVNGRKYGSGALHTTYRKASGAEQGFLLRAQNDAATADHRRYITDLMRHLNTRLGIDPNGDMSNPRNLVLPRLGGLRVELSPYKEPEDDYRHEGLFGEMKAEQATNEASDILNNRDHRNTITNGLQERAESKLGRKLSEEELERSYDAIKKHGNFNAGLEVHGLLGEEDEPEADEF